VLIDWFTVGAQVVNFLVLVALLKRFLYGPIIRNMDRREERIAAGFAEAEATLNSARTREEECRQLQQKLEEARGDRLREAEEEAENRHRELLETARTEVAELRAAWLGALRREEEEFFRELKKRIGAEVLNIARKSLADLADADLEQRLVKNFARRFAGLEADEHDQIVAAVRTDGLTVRSPFTLPEDLRRNLVEELCHVLGHEVEVSFTTDQDMPLGIELTVGGLKVSWGVDGYFGELQRTIAALYVAQLAEYPPSESSEPDRDMQRKPREEP
jgi:F-type H+-transporting ATPase subunit b